MYKLQTTLHGRTVIYPHNSLASVKAQKLLFAKIDPCSAIIAWDARTGKIVEVYSDEQAKARIRK